MDLDAEDDIIASARLANSQEQPHLVLTELQNMFELLPEGDPARKQRANHRSARDLVRWQYFKGK